MIGKIEILGMKFHASHGCFDFERKDGGDYLVDFSCKYDISRAARTDDLRDTLDYSVIYNIVAEQMTPPCNLIETLACRIADAIKAAFPALEHFTISVSKLSPPTGGPSACSRITIEV